jgi:cell division ATPase FtsA
MMEILINVDHQIELSGYRKKLIGGIVLTGGGSQLKNLVKMTDYETGLYARLGFPREHLAPSKIKNIDSPIFATGIGLLIRAFKQHDKNRMIEQERQAHLGFDKKEKPTNVETPATPVDLEIPVPHEEDEWNEKKDFINEKKEKREELPKARKPSLVSSWGDKITNWFKSDTDWSDV